MPLDICVELEMFVVIEDLGEILNGRFIGTYGLVKNIFNTCTFVWNV